MDRKIEILKSSNKIGGGTSGVKGYNIDKMYSSTTKTDNPKDEFVVKIGVEVKNQGKVKTKQGKPLTNEDGTPKLDEDGNQEFAAEDVWAEGGNELDIIRGWHDEEQWSESLGNVYTAFNSTASGIADSFTTPFGFSLRNRTMFRKVWADATPPTFNIKLFFKSYDNAYTDVYEPVRKLQLCFVPSEMDGRKYGTGDGKANTSVTKGVKGGLQLVWDKLKEGILAAPGPAFITGGFLKNIQGMHEKNIIRFIKISNFITLYNILPTSINVDWNIKEKERVPSHVSITGATEGSRTYPSSAVVTISFEALELWTNYEIYSLLTKNHDTQVSDQSGLNLDDVWESVKSLMGK